MGGSFRPSMISYSRSRPRVWPEIVDLTTVVMTKRFRIQLYIKMHRTSCLIYIITRFSCSFAVGESPLASAMHSFSQNKHRSFECPQPQPIAWAVPSGFRIPKMAAVVVWYRMWEMHLKNTHTHTNTCCEKAPYEHWWLVGFMDLSLSTTINEYPK